MAENKFYITTSIAYVNAPPHIGFALESLQADTLARWQRQQKKEVFFLTGTDDHGAKIVRAAEAAGKNPKEFIDEHSAEFKKLKTALNLSWDNFIRTSDQKNHWPVAQEIWRRIAAAGDLYKKNYKGLYCLGHEAFITQKDLVDGKCGDHQKEPEIIEEENWFFRLSRYSQRIKETIESGKLKIFPESRKNEVLSLLNDGLEDISFSRSSRDLSWGVPVPEDNSQTMYVWADALSNYISGYGGIEAWEEHPADVHFVGKDILRFHAAIWPAMLLSAGLKLPKALFVHGYILSGGQKMSKSLGNVIDPFELVKKYGTDVVRYYLLREMPSAEDGDFSYEKFEGRYNADLANGLGNFASRVSTLAAKEEKLISGMELIDGGISDQLTVQSRKVASKIENFRFNEALTAIWQLIQNGDQYINELKPWDKSVALEARIKILFNLVTVLDCVSLLLAPFLPETAEKIARAIQKNDGKFTVKKIENLFPRLEK